MNKILMVEEELGTVKKVQERLSRFEVLSAGDGRLGFQIAKEKAPDLIIADSVIPVMSGYELCKAIKLDQETKSIPLVVMTEKHRMEESFMFLGIKDFLDKPLNLEELEKVVSKKLNLSESMNLKRSTILIYGRPEVLTCCQQLLKNDIHWSGYFANNHDSLLEQAIKHSPDVIFMDLLAPGAPADELIKKLKLIPELKNTIVLTYYTTSSTSQDQVTVQARMIEVQYMKVLTQEAGAKEYLGAFNPVTFMNLINIYRREFNFII